MVETLWERERGRSLMPGIDITDDAVTFSQSWINTFLLCPEQARLEMMGLLPRKESDATAIGSAMHAGIEAVLGGASITDGEAAAIDTLEELIALPTFEWVQIKTRDTAAKTLQRVYYTWANEVYPQLPGPRAIEHKFDIEIGIVNGRLLRIKGAIDYIDELGDVWDWKTAASDRMWEQWSVDRYKIQPTVYTLALAHEENDFETPRDFHYCVMFKPSQAHSIYSTTRTQAHWDWLTRQCKSIAYMLDADLPVWPMNDQHALCSQKWCTAWSSCKGAHL